MSDRRRFLKGLTSLPLATVLANPRLAAAVSAGLQEVEAKLADGRTIKAALATPQDQAKGSILLVHEWWGLLDQILARPLFGSCACIRTGGGTDRDSGSGFFSRSHQPPMSKWSWAFVFATECPEVQWAN